MAPPNNPNEEKSGLLSNRNKPAESQKQDIDYNDFDEFNDEQEKPSTINRVFQKKRSKVLHAAPIAKSRLLTSNFEEVDNQVHQISKEVKQQELKFVQITTSLLKKLAENQKKYGGQSVSFNDTYMNEVFNLTDDNQPETFIEKYLCSNIRLAICCAQLAVESPGDTAVNRKIQQTVALLVDNIKNQPYFYYFDFTENLDIKQRNQLLNFHWKKANGMDTMTLEQIGQIVKTQFYLPYCEPNKQLYFANFPIEIDADDSSLFRGLLFGDPLECFSIFKEIHYSLKSIFKYSPSINVSNLVQLTPTCRTLVSETNRNNPDWISAFATSEKNLKLILSNKLIEISRLVANLKASTVDMVEQAEKILLALYWP